MPSKNILMAIKEKEKWEHRLSEMEEELEALQKRRKEILSELVRIKDFRDELYEKLGDAYADEMDANVFKNRGDVEAMNPRR